MNKQQQKQRTYKYPICRNCKTHKSKNQSDVLFAGGKENVDNFFCELRQYSINRSTCWLIRKFIYDEDFPGWEKKPIASHNL